MQAPDVERFLDGGGAEFVGLSDADTALDAAAGHPHGEAVAVVVAAGALGVLGCRLAAELTPPNDERLVEQPALIEILQQCGDRLVGVAGVVVVIFFQVTVGVPVGVVVVSAGVNLDEAHTALDEPPGEQALAAEVVGAVVAKAVQFPDVFRFAVEVSRLGRAHLHLVGQLVAGDAGRQRGVVRAFAEVLSVVLVQLVDDHPLLFAAHVAGVLQIEDWRPAGVHDHALIGRRHVAAGPVLGTADRAAGAVQHHDVAGEALVHRAEAVVDPRAHRGPAAQDAAGVHHEHRRAVNRRVGGHRVEERNLVHVPGDVREKAAHPLAALAVLHEVPLWPHDAAQVFFAATPEGLHLNRLAVERIQLRLVVERVHVAWPAVHEQENHALGLARQRRIPWRQRIAPRRLAVGGNGLAVDEAVPGHQPGQRQRREAAAHLVHELTARGAPAECVPRSVAVFTHGRLLTCGSVQIQKLVQIQH